jgi:hypothetical protein
MYINPHEIEALLIAVGGDYAKSVFLKTDNYVCGHMTQSVAKGKDTFPRDWWINYLLGECKLNADALTRGETINMFVGDALHHSWIMHYQIVQRGDNYQFTRSN